MMNIMMASTLIILISMIIMKLSMLISKKMKLDNEKMSPFECGFNLISNSRIPFSLRFFLITIIFLIFDIEIALLIPMMLTFFTSNMKFWISTILLFLLILLIGIFHEWNQGALNWM